MENIDQNIPFALIAKSLSGECNEEETKELENWIADNAENMKEFKKIQKTWDEATPDTYEVNIENALNKVSGKLSVKTQTKKLHQNIFFRIASAIILGLGILGIVLSVNKLPDTEYYVSLPNAKPQEYILPDGSKITMNAGSSLSFPKNFPKDERRIAFEGEAYFIIAKNKEKPFIIESANTVTKVIGTEFNLTTQSADSVVRINVAEGLVSFNLKNDADLKEVFVKPGQVGEANSRTGIITSQTNKNLNYLAWKTGILTFKNHSFSDAMTTLSDYYNKNIIVNDSSLRNALFSASFDSLPLADVIPTISLIMDVDIEYRKDAIIIREKL